MQFYSKKNVARWNQKKKKIVKRNKAEGQNGQRPVYSANTTLNSSADRKECNNKHEK